MEAMEGKMIRVGTALDAKKPVADLGALADGSDGKRKPFLLVLGNEENGISDVVREKCDALVIIPWEGMADGKKSKIDSLNVAQASSIIFYEVMKSKVSKN